MDQTNLYLIGWEKNLKDSYNYGSKISFLFNGSTHFSNYLMSPGTALYTWSSEKSYQATRNFANLPRLIPGEEYTVTMTYQAVPQNGIYWQITCQDIDGQVVYDENFDKSQATFTYPSNAYQYTIRLVNIRHETVFFKLLMICRKRLLLANQLKTITTQIQPLLLMPPKITAKTTMQVVLINRDAAIRMYPISDNGVTICMNLYFLKQMPSARMTREIYSSFQKILQELVQAYEPRALKQLLANFTFINYAGKVSNAQTTAQQIKTVWQTVVAAKKIN